MTEQGVFSKLKADYPDIVSEHYPFPEPYRGSGEIRAIILGADPTHAPKGQPHRIFNMVFELDNPKSPYFRSIQKNIGLVSGLSMEHVYVQNLCRNYFTRETSQNPDWEKIARDYWAAHLADELNSMFSPSVPILATTQFILSACLKGRKVEKAGKIYTECISIPGMDNILGRDIIAFYRHHWYSLDKWDDYRRFVLERINRGS